MARLDGPRPAERGDRGSSLRMIGRANNMIGCDGFVYEKETQDIELIYTPKKYIHVHDWVVMEYTTRIITMLLNTSTHDCWLSRRGKSCWLGPSWLSPGDWRCEPLCGGSLQRILRI